MAEKHPRPRLRHPRRRPRPGLPAPRERDRADRGRPRPAARAHLDAQRHGPVRRGEDGEVGREHHAARRRARRVRPRRADHVLPGGPLPPAARRYSDEALEQARRSVERVAQLRPPGRALGPDADGGRARPAVAALRDEFFAALRDDFNTPQALAGAVRAGGGGQRRLEAGGALPGRAAALARDARRSLGLENLLERREPVDEEAERLAAEREQARRDAGLRARGRAARRAAERGYEVRDTAEGPVLVPIAARP